MRILMVGDVVGKSGRQAVQELVPRLRSQHKADFVVVNAENAAGGIGITSEIAEDLLRRTKIDVITLGNHAWTKREVWQYLDEEPRILRPENYPPGAPGRGIGVYQTDIGPIAIMVMQGCAFMEPLDNPFRLADDLIDDIQKSARVILVDFHAEATSEKVAYGWHLDGRVTAVVGTHTHVQTADERVLPGGTAFITDVGMTGPRDSVIGMRIDTALPRFITRLPSKFEAADGPSILNAVLIEADTSTGQAISITRIQESHGV